MRHMLVLVLVLVLLLHLHSRGFNQLYQPHHTALTSTRQRATRRRSTRGVTLASALLISSLLTAPAAAGAAGLCIMYRGERGEGDLCATWIGRS